VVPCDTDTSDFVTDSLALLWQDRDTFAVVQISSVAVGQLTLSAAVGTTFASAYIMPLRAGFTVDKAGMVRSGFSDTITVKYDVDDNVVTTSTAPTQFLTHDLYFDTLIKVGSTYATEVQAEEDIADYQLGAKDRVSPWTYNRVLGSYRKIMRTPEEVYAFKQWAHRRAGKYRDFWWPSFENDLRVKNAGTITTTLQWWKDSFDEWATDRVHIAVQDLAGNWYARTLSSISALDATTMQGTLSSSLGVLASNVYRICYLGLKRLSSDSLKFDFMGNGVSKCDFGILEISP
jgi:hypothetical protein